MNESTQVLYESLSRCKRCLESLRDIPCITGEQFKVRFRAMYDDKRICNMEEVNWDLVCKNILENI